MMSKSGLGGVHFVWFVCKVKLFMVMAQIISVIKKKKKLLGTWQ